MPFPSPTRRDALKSLACGFGHLAFCGAAARAAGTAAPHFAPRAKRMIFLFMQGGPSHVDTFDYKPALVGGDGKSVSLHDPRKIANSGELAESEHRLMAPRWKFGRHGEAGLWVSELLPEIARHADDLCVIRSMHTDGIAHGPATLFLHCGSTNLVRPSMGSWLSYGLGSGNADLPAFLTIGPSAGNGGPRNYGSAFLPPVHQGTPVGAAARPYSRSGIRHLDNPRASDAERVALYELSRRMHLAQAAARPEDLAFEAELASLELGWRMQSTVPTLLDVEAEPEETKRLYGIDRQESADFGRRCLLARRLAESGVRFIQVTYGDDTANPAWDQHSNIEQHERHARATDRPVAGLLADLKRRGLLDDTIVWWGGEFGRTPYAQTNGTGRDHNPVGFTAFVAGGGFRGGYAHGATDEIGQRAVADKVHMHDLHATLLHQLGLDHERLTFRHAGRDFRLTDVHGRVVRELLA